MQFLRQLIARWIKTRVAQETTAPGALQPLRREDLARAVGGVIEQTDSPRGNW